MADEYIRKQDAVDEINTNADDLEQNGGIPYAQGARAMAIVVERIPSADVVQVVRCKDCKRCVPDAVCGQIGRLWCKLRRLVKPDDFCSYGKRKE